MTEATKASAQAAAFGWDMDRFLRDADARINRLWWWGRRREAEHDDILMKAPDGGIVWGKPGDFAK